MPTHIISFNVQRLQSPNSHRHFIRFTQNHRHSFILLQEHHLSSDAQQQAFAASLAGKIFFTQHLAILIPPSISDDSISNPIPSLDGRSLQLSITFPTHTLSLTNIYAPNLPKDRDTFFRSLLPASSLANTISVLAGDFNDAPNLKLDRSNQRSASTVWPTLISATNSTYFDTFRYLHPLSLSYSRPNTRFNKLVSKSRIDLTLLSTSASSLLTASSILPKLSFSDHRPVKLTLNLTLDPSNPHQLSTSNSSLWRLNTSFLLNANHKEEIHDFLADGLLPFLHEFPSPFDWLNKAIPAVTEFLRTKSRRDAETKKREWRRLATSMRDIEAMMDPSEAHLQHWKEAKDALELAEWEETRGIKLRANLPDFETTGQAAESLNLQAARRLHQVTIPQLTLPDGSITTNIDLAIQEVHRFYSTLYTPDPPSPNRDAKRHSLLSHLLDQPGSDPRFLRRLTPTQRAILEAPFTPEEVSASIRDQRNSASPGASGLPFEFFKLFEEFWSPVLCEVLNASWEEGRLSETELQALIRMIYKYSKPGADISKLTFHRPVSLLETIYKIRTKVFVRRFTNILPLIIPPSQFGFVPGRRSSDAAIHLRTILDFFRSHPDISGLLLSLDQEKAYDLVDHSWIHDVFSAIGCGPRFLSHLSTILSTGKRYSRVIVNGFLTPPIPMQCGVGQGDGFSCPTYDIVFQPFIDALTIRAIASIIPSTPTTLPPLQHLSSLHIQSALAFADDTILTILSLTARQNLDTLISDWREASGGRVMVAKSTQLPLNLTPNHPLLIPGVKTIGLDEVWIWVGFPFAWNEPATEAYYTALLVTLKRRLDHAKTFSLSLTSRVLYANTRVLGKIRHVLDAFPPPPNFLIQLDSASVDFIWIGRHLVNTDIAFLPRPAGGVGIISSRKVSDLARQKFWIAYLT
ncbi:hypothetical protein P7C70_g5867, partial [Phenoliferia sp. Uapishka_3]